MYEDLIRRALSGVQTLIIIVAVVVGILMFGAGFACGRGHWKLPHIEWR